MLFCDADDSRRFVRVVFKSERRRVGCDHEIVSDSLVDGVSSQLNRGLRPAENQDPYVLRVIFVMLAVGGKEIRAGDLIHDPAAGIEKSGEEIEDPAVAHDVIRARIVVVEFTILLKEHHVIDIGRDYDAVVKLTDEVVKLPVVDFCVEDPDGFQFGFQEGVELVRA
jgi:hypothetical protein